MGKKSGAAKHSDKASKKRKAGAPGGEHWQEEPDEHDYPAAAAYLSLIHTTEGVRRLVLALKKAAVERRLAKDLLRASALPLLPVDNAHVASDLAKVKNGVKLSPVLLVRGDATRGIPLTIADGYHRVCASYHLDENAAIPCHLVDFTVL
jgi:hypothetical protein